MSDKIIKMGAESAIDIANKYLDAPINQVDFKESFEDTSYKIFTDKKRDTSKGLIKLKDGSNIEVEEGSFLYEKVRGLAKEKFLMVDAETFINPSEIAQFHDISHEIDWATKDVEKPEEQEVDPNWRKVFYDEN
ncbi:hypothetical protein KM927_29825 [Priestia megaterium]|uniref:hypothetical protein n=2 Tax=Priestia megaterium TaxID=1404 RepID=UPI001C236376|nr:hypothetical protein [Priestia megaterium]MBU8757647.1 hypothetical protein [Priestia megaterium]